MFLIEKAWWSPNKGVRPKYDTMNLLFYLTDMVKSVTSTILVVNSLRMYPKLDPNLPQVLPRKKL